MNREEFGLAMMRGLVKRPRLANAAFRLDKWGNIIGPDRFTNPYPIYERMRQAGPVSFSPFFQQWAVVGYEEARFVLSSPSFGAADQLELLLRARPYSELAEDSKNLLRNALLFTDPPLHTRLRAVVSRAFTPKQMRRLEPRISSLVKDHLAGVADDVAPDLVAHLTAPLPINVIAELLGVPEERWAWVSRVSLELREMLDPFKPVDPVVVDATVEEVAAYYGSLADQRLANPQDDLITAFAQAQQGDDPITRHELVSLIAILMLAGHETITGALGNAIVALAQFPEQRALVRQRPGLWPNAVDELLRFDTVLHTVARAALETTTVGGQTIKKGQNVTVMLGAVNRDPRRWDRPNELLLDRENPSPLSFGHGIHHCVGAALARLQMRIALQAVVETFGDYTVDLDAVTWRESLAFRGPTRLPVRGLTAPERSPVD